MKKYRIKNKLLFRLLLVSLIFIIIGLFYTAILSNSDLELIKKNVSIFFKDLEKLNYLKAFFRCLFTNMFYIFFIWILGISIIGIPVIILLLIIKSFILGFSISSILYIYKFKGIFICLFYIIPLLINLFTIIYLSYYSISFSKRLNILLFFKKNISFNDSFKKYIKVLITSIILIMFSSFIEIYIIPFILNLLQIK